MLDEQIIELYWARSEDAISCTEQKYGSYCRTIAWNILYSEEDTVECLNDTWLRAWQAIPPTRPQILKAFLGKITRNLALNMYEKQHAQRRGSGEVTVCLDELGESVPSFERTDAVVENMVLTETINRFLKGLSEEDRRFFVQRYYYLLPVKEVASLAGMGESRVKMRLSRIREKLKNMLEKEEIFL